MCACVCCFVIGRSFAFNPELCVCVRVHVEQALIKGSAVKQQHFISAGREIKFLLIGPPTSPSPSEGNKVLNWGVLSEGGGGGGVWRCSELDNR